MITNRAKVSPYVYVGLKDVQIEFGIETYLLKMVSKHYNVSIEDIKGRKRQRHIIIARHVYAYLLRKFCKMSLKQIGLVIGGRDHSTQISAITQVDNHLKYDKEFSKQYNDLLTKI